MNFGKFDITILIVMSLAIVGMSFVFPALGLTEAGTDENDIPEFDMQSDRFDFVGDFPDAPGTPTEGELTWDGTQEAAFNDNQIWLDGDTSDGTEVVLLSSNNGTIRINNWDSGSIADNTEFNFDSEGDQYSLNDYGYEMRFYVDSYSVESDGTGNYVISFEIVDQPVTDGGWISRVPIIGGAYSTAEATAATLAWFGSIILWFFGTLFEVVTNGIGMIVDTITYGFNLVKWLTSTYSDVIAGANSWATVFVSLPGILLALVLAKLAFIGIKLLPQT